MRVINFFAGPGAGKSTTAAALFALMKMHGHRVELVTEYPKELLYEGSFYRMRNQLLILAEHDLRLRRLYRHVDFAITDSPLLMGLAYVKGGPFDNHWFHNAVSSVFNSYDNINFFVRAVKPYQPDGRRESEASARALDTDIKCLLALYPHSTIDGDAMAAQRAYDIVMEQSR